MNPAPHHQRPESGGVLASSPAHYPWLALSMSLCYYVTHQATSSWGAGVITLSVGVAVKNWALDAGGWFKPECCYHLGVGRTGVNQENCRCRPSLPHP